MLCGLDGGAVRWRARAEHVSARNGVHPAAVACKCKLPIALVLTSAGSVCVTALLPACTQRSVQRGPGRRHPLRRVAAATRHHLCAPALQQLHPRAPAGAAGPSGRPSSSQPGLQPHQRQHPAPARAPQAAHTAGPEPKPAAGAHSWGARPAAPALRAQPSKCGAWGEACGRGAVWVRAGDVSSVLWQQRAAVHSLGRAACYALPSKYTCCAVLPVHVRTCAALASGSPPLQTARHVSLFVCSTAELAVVFDTRRPCAAGQPGRAGAVGEQAPRSPAVQLDTPRPAAHAEAGEQRAGGDPTRSVGGWRIPGGLEAGTANMCGWLPGRLERCALSTGAQGSRLRSTLRCGMPRAALPLFRRL